MKTTQPTNPKVTRYSRPLALASVQRVTPQQPRLWFSPSAWIKLNWLAHAGETEIGGLGFTPDPNSLLVTDFKLLTQRCTPITVAFDDEAVADYFEQSVDAGRRPEQFSRIWLHSHPGDCPNPSGTDEETFQRVFGECSWAIMFILARNGATYARLRFGVGPRGQMIIPVGIRWDLPIASINQSLWAEEYTSCVQVIDDLTDKWPSWWDEPTDAKVNTLDDPDLPELDLLGEELGDMGAEVAYGRHI